LCKLCHAAYMRTWRTTHPLSDEERRKDICRSYTNVLIRRGHMQRKPCWCGSRGEAHHPDYARPRLVIWMCRKHHRAFHQWINSLIPATRCRVPYTRT